MPTDRPFRSDAEPTPESRERAEFYGFRGRDAMYVGNIIDDAESRVREEVEPLREALRGILDTAGIRGGDYDALALAKWHEKARALLRELDATDEARRKRWRKR